MSISSVKLEDTGSDAERAAAATLNGPSIPALSESSEVAVLREENCRLMTTLLEYKKTLENTKLRYGSVKKDYYAAKKRLKRLADKLGQSVGGDSESRESTPTSCVQPAVAAPVDDEIRKKWKEPNVKAALKLKAAIGVAAYQSLIRDGELALPSLRTMSRYVDALKRAGLKPNYDFNVRDDGTDLAGGRMFEDEDDEDSREVDHNRNQQQVGANKQHLPQQQQQSRDVSDAEDPVNFTAVPDISYYRGKMEVDDTDEMDDDDQPEMYHHQNGDTNGGGVQVYRPHPNQHTVHNQQQQQQTLTSGHIEFLKQMTGFRKKWTPFELRTCMDIRRIIGSKEYDSLRKNDGMPLPSAKTLRKYKHTVHLDGVDVMSRKRNFKEMVDGVVPGMPNGNGMNGLAGYGNDADDILNAEEPEGFFDINGLSEEQIDFLQSLSSNTKGFSDFELQKTLELKNELGGHNYEILRKQECLQVPTLAMLKKYEQENGLEDLSAMVVVEDVDEEDDAEPEQEPELDQEYDNEFALPPDHFGPLDMMNGGGGGTGEDSHMGIFEHHSIFDRDDASSTTFDMGKLSQQHVEFLNTLPENPKRWTTEMINSALDIKNEIGTRDYELLRRQGIPLPAARTLRRHKDIKTRVEGDVV